MLGSKFCKVARSKQAEFAKYPLFRQRVTGICLSCSRVSLKKTRRIVIGKNRLCDVLPPVRVENHILCVTPELGEKAWR